jgi:protein-S-isoprenylcysteine O-methyltransferase Ste14
VRLTQQLAEKFTSTGFWEGHDVQSCRSVIENVSALQRLGALFHDFRSLSSRMREHSHQCEHPPRIIFAMNWSRLVEYLIEIPWLIFVLYWAAGTLKTRRTVATESFASRYGVLFLEVAGFVLIFKESAGIGILGHQIFPETYALAAAGVALTWIGIAIALWARWHLGQYWSARVTLKEDHQLIRTGPYAHFRHPIYSGIILAAIGGALAIDRWQCVAGIAVIILGYSIKAKREESMLTAQFGEAFQEHCRHTGFLLPKF